MPRFSFLRCTFHRALLLSRVLSSSSLFYFGLFFLSRSARGVLGSVLAWLRDVQDRTGQTGMGWSAGVLYLFELCHALFFFFFPRLLGIPDGRASGVHGVGARSLSKSNYLSLSSTPYVFHAAGPLNSNCLLTPMTPSVSARKSANPSGESGHPMPAVSPFLSGGFRASF